MFKKLFNKEIFTHWKTSILGSTVIMKAIYNIVQNPIDWQEYAVQICIGVALLYAKEIGIVKSVELK